MRRLDAFDAMITRRSWPSHGRPHACTSLPVDREENVDDASITSEVKAKLATEKMSA